MGVSGRQQRIGASRGSVLALAALSFLAGGAAGAVAHHGYACRCPPALARKAVSSWKADQMERWTRALDLNQAQRNRLEAALDTVHRRYRSLFGEIEPQKREIDADLKTRIAAFLDAKQRERYETELAKTEERRKAYYDLRDARAIANPIRSAAGKEPASEDGSHP